MASHAEYQDPAFRILGFGISASHCSPPSTGVDKMGEGPKLVAVDLLGGCLPPTELVKRITQARVAALAFSLDAGRRRSASISCHFVPFSM